MLDPLSGTGKYSAGRVSVSCVPECVCWRLHVFFKSYFHFLLSALDIKCFSVRNHSFVYHLSCIFFSHLNVVCGYCLKAWHMIDWTWQCQMNLMRAAAVGQRAKQIWDQVLSPPWSWECSPTEPLLN